MLGAVAWLLTGLAGLLWVLVTVLLLGALRPRVPTAWVLSKYQAQPLPRAAALTVVGSAGRARAIATVVP